MPRASWVQNNFNGGEWSPLTFGRADIAKYRNGLETCLNYVPTAQGGLTRRPGTRYVASTKSNAAARLVRFEFSTTQAYVLEFGDQYVRFYTNDGQLLSGGSPYEVATPYLAADIWNLSFTQSADVLYIVHPSYAPRKLVRAGATSWTLSTISFLDGPYMPLNTSATTLTLSSAGPGTGITVTASATTGINGGTGFTAADVGRVFRFRSGGTTWGWGTFTAYTSSTVMTATITTAPNSAAASATWRLGVWGGPNGYPSCVTFHQDRLVFSGATGFPGRVDGSNTGDYENFAPSDSTGTVTDANAYSFTLNSNTVNAIQWMVSDEFGLLCGTAGGEWVIAPGASTQSGLTPTNVNAKNVTSYGSTNVQPIKIGKQVLFVQRTKRKLREMAYRFDLNTYQAQDISMIGEHLTKSGLRQMAVQLAPQPIVWIARTDGTLVGVSYDKDQEILGWHQHQLGGYSDSGQSVAPVVESVAAIPAPSVDRDQVWVIVRRYINGATVRYVELMTKYWEDGDIAADTPYMDSSSQYSGAATSTISGLTWLAGQTVKVLADGSTHPDCVVSAGGAITLQRDVTKAQVGLGYVSQGKTMRIEAGAADGTAQSKLKRVFRVMFRFFQSVGLEFYSESTGEWYPQDWRTSADLMDNGVSLFTGDKVWTYDGTWDRDGQVQWRQSDPLPSNVLQIVAQMDTQDNQ